VLDYIRLYANSANRVALDALKSPKVEHLATTGESTASMPRWPPENMLRRRTNHDPADRTPADPPVWASGADLRAAGWRPDRRV